MKYQQAIIMPVILVNLMLQGCNMSNETGELNPQSTIKNSALASSLCLASIEGDSDIDMLINRQVKQIQNQPNKLKSWVDLGDSWVKKSKLSNDPGFFLHAEQCVNAVLESGIYFLSAQELQLQILLNKHEFNSARILAKKIVKTSPDSRLGWASLSDAFLELGNIEEAQKSVEKLQNLQAGMAFFTRISYLHWLRGDIKAANDALLAALQRRDMKNPHAAAWTFVQGANISWQRNDLVGAEALYKESLKWMPDFPLALIGLARVEVARKNPQAAIGFLENIEEFKLNAEALWLLADANEMAGNLLVAGKSQDRVIAISRSGDPLLLARFLSSKDRDHLLALELIEKERLTRGGIYIEDAYAWVLYRLGRFEEAQIAIDKALDWGTQDAKLFYHAGAIKIATGHILEGMSLVRQALALQPLFDFTGAKEAVQLIQQYGDSENVWFS